MKMRPGYLYLAAIVGAAVTYPARAGELIGPGRFCGYSPIVDLLAGEKVTTLEGGIHAGTFRWQGRFGTLYVTGMGWASRPAGRMIRTADGTRPAIFAPHRVPNGYQIAIWNRRQGAAYFNSFRPFTAAQRRAIERVTLFQEGEDPTGCKLRTVFSWDP